MTYTTNIKNVNDIGYGSYKFVEHDGQVVIGTEYNSKVIFTKADGSVDKSRTVRSLLRCYAYHAKQAAYRKAGGIRHYIGIQRMTKQYM